jgi:hypothetical protein
MRKPRAQGTTSPDPRASSQVVAPSAAGPRYPRPKILVIDAPDVTPVLQQRGYGLCPAPLASPLLFRREPVTCR